MNIGIIGAGNVGTGIGKRLAARGHRIVVSFSRSQDGLEAAARLIGDDTRSGSPEEAARFGDVVVLATPWGVTLDAVRGVAPALADRVVWDATNPLKPDMSGLEIGTSTSAGEEVARAAPGAPRGEGHPALRRGAALAFHPAWKRPTQRVRLRR